MTKINGSIGYNGTERKVQAVGGSPSAANVGIEVGSGLFRQPRAYPAFTTCLQSVNCLQPQEFVQRVRRAIAQYPHLRKRIGLLLAWEEANTCSNADIAYKLLDEYLAHRLDSKQLLMLDEIINLTL